MKDIKIPIEFNDVSQEFIIFVIGQEYLYSSKGNFLKKYYNTDNWISSDRVIERKINRLIRTTQKIYLTCLN